VADRACADSDQYWWISLWHDAQALTEVYGPPGAEGEVEATGAAGAWATTSGALAIDDSVSDGFETWPPAGAVPIDVAGLYPRLAEVGLRYGPAFQGLQQILVAVVIDLELGIAGHPEQLVFEDLHAGEELTQVGGDELLHRQEAGLAPARVGTGGHHAGPAR